MPWLAALALSPVARGQAVQWLDADLWAAPRSGAAVAEMPPVRAVAGDLLRNPATRLVVRYPGGEDGLLWAQELRAWLIASGIESGRIELQAGGVRPDALELMVGVAGPK